MKKLMIAASAALVATVGLCVESANIVGYASRDFNKDTSIINMLTFQWDTVSGSTRKIGDILKCSVMGTAWNHGTADDVTPGWQNSAPMIQIRRADGGYTILYYADDAWDDANQVCVPGWANEFGSLVNVTIEVGGGFWMQNPNDNGQMFLTVKNPVK